MQLLIKLLIYITHNLNRQRLPQYRKSNQVWVMNLREAPPKSQWPDPYINMFNWTIGYRKDCTFWLPYARTVKIRSGTHKTAKIVNKNLKEWISKKSRLVAGVISNCHSDSNREEVIRKMKSTGVPVDIYGACGDNQICGRHDHNCDTFWSNLAKTYKFFLAFENALCTDYITEKLWRSLNLGMVPVVYGGGNYQVDVPPGSYINVMDFKSAKQLMQYLEYVGRNQTEYAKFFEWRNDYNIINERNSVWSDLCSALVQQRTHQGKKDHSYENLLEWWESKPGSKQPACLRKPALFLKK